MTIAPRSERLVMIYLPMDLDDFCTITEAIAKVWPNARIGDPDDEGQVLVLRPASPDEGDA